MSRIGDFNSKSLWPRFNLWLSEQDAAMKQRCRPAQMQAYSEVMEARKAVLRKHMFAPVARLLARHGFHDAATFLRRQ
jgi:hypothetical protein